MGIENSYLIVKNYLLVRMGASFSTLPLVDCEGPLFGQDGRKLLHFTFIYLGRINCLHWEKLGIIGENWEELGVK